MNYPMSIVSNQKEESISIHRVKVNTHKIQEWAGNLFEILIA